MKITELLEVEHEFLRSLMETFSQWITEGVAPDKLRERAAMLEIAIDDHATREEKLLFEPLAFCSTVARELIGMMEMVHVEVRDLFEQVADPARDPKEQLWTILMLTDEHFTKEETGVFPMAERLLDPEILQV
ncbi:MAG: hemerythrin domain-containing protein [Anaerolineae bacterium]|nr:hemerythrin domain-containing protein [Anaerolineae bacterium]